MTSKKRQPKRKRTIKRKIKGGTPVEDVLKQKYVREIMFNHYSPGNKVAWRTSINLLPRVVIN